MAALIGLPWVSSPFFLNRTHANQSKECGNVVARSIKMVAVIQ